MGEEFNVRPVNVMVACVNVLVGRAVSLAMRSQWLLFVLARLKLCVRRQEEVLKLCVCVHLRAYVSLSLFTGFGLPSQGVGVRKVREVRE